VLLDNYDSFTYNLKDYLEQYGYIVKVVRNDECTVEEIEALNPKGIVISPGPNRPENAGITMELIERFQNTKPILGVCLGHQAIGTYFGAELVRTPRPVHGKTSTLTHSDHKMFEEIQAPIEVCRYHSLTLEKVVDPMMVLARSEDNCIMAIAHKTLPIWGVQFHPEAILSTGGLRLLGNWLQLSK